MEIVTMIPFPWIFIGVQIFLLSLFVKKQTNKQPNPTTSKSIWMCLALQVLSYNTFRKHDSLLLSAADKTAEM